MPWRGTAGAFARSDCGLRRSARPSSPRASSSIAAGVVDTLPGEPEECPCEQQDDREEEPGDRCAVAHLAEDEGLAEQLEVDEQRRVVRITASVRERVRLGEVLERRDHRD